MEKTIYCPVHPKEVLAYIKTEGDKNELYCSECFIKQDASKYKKIQDVFEECVNINSKQSEFDDKTLKVYEEYQAILFAKDETLSDLAHHIEQQKKEFTHELSKIAKDFQQLLEDVQKLIFTVLDKQVENLNAVFLEYDSVLTKSFQGSKARSKDLSSMEALKSQYQQADNIDKLKLLIKQCKEDIASKTPNVHIVQRCHQDLTLKSQRRPTVQKNKLSEILDPCRTLQERLPTVQSSWVDSMIQDVWGTEPRFHAPYGGYNISKSAGKSKLVRLLKSGYLPVISQPLGQSKFQITIKIDNLPGNFYFGLCSAVAKPVQGINHSRPGRYLIGQNDIWENGTSKQCSNSNFTHGDELTLHVTFHDTISFLKNQQIIAEMKFAPEHKDTQFYILVEASTNHTEFSIVKWEFHD